MLLACAWFGLDFDFICILVEWGFKYSGFGQFNISLDLGFWRLVA